MDLKMLGSVNQPEETLAILRDKLLVGLDR